jgi:hypothetical protein
MQDEVTEPWASEADVLDLSDTDLEASRMNTSGVSDPDRELHRLIGTYMHHEGVPVSVAIDRALRVQLAYLLDSHLVPFTRDTFDVAYSLPPSGWLTRHRFPTRDLLELNELPEATNPEDPGLSYSTSPVVREMVERAIKNTDIETISEFAKLGARRLVGQD